MQYYTLLKTGVSDQFNNLKSKVIFKDFATLNLTTVHPFVYKLLDDYDNKLINDNQLLELLDFTLKYVVIIMISSNKSNRFNKLFASLYSISFPDYVQEEDESKNDKLVNYVENIKKAFWSISTSDLRIPSKEVFIEATLKRDFYGKNNVFTKFLLCKIDESLSHKEKFDYSNKTIEHIMPQTLNEQWKKDLGENWQIIHEMYLNKLGNLTLTSYNSEISNSSFSIKKDYLFNINNSSHIDCLPINKVFLEKFNTFKEQDLINRSREITEKLWEVFKLENPNNDFVNDLNFKHTIKTVSLNELLKDDILWSKTKILEVYFENHPPIDCSEKKFVDVFEKIFVEYIFANNKNVLLDRFRNDFVNKQSTFGLKIVQNSTDSREKCFVLESGKLYLSTHSSTKGKLSFLRRILNFLHIDLDAISFKVDLYTIGD